MRYEVMRAYVVVVAVVRKERENTRCYKTQEYQTMLALMGRML